MTFLWKSLDFHYPLCYNTDETIIKVLQQNGMRPSFQHFLCVVIPCGTVADSLPDAPTTAEHSNRLQDFPFELKAAANSF